ncbi:LSM domain-containing protein [Halocatena salina]|uniref:LSM domain-containing protein n=1 Tax=Halocatena salina TaxID=2934340 RepID=A0A8U0A908_9EURY|nr:LSM domain-containing protein [Halocatena salina]UPM44958.1 LSM domain-containing protein [Halocatena salina]
MSDNDEAAATTPLDSLKDTVGSRVTVRTKADQLIEGTLAGVDEHMNLTLAVSSATDNHDTDDDHRLVRGTRVVTITHPPIGSETT